jgi:hypothetical protein
VHLDVAAAGVHGARTGCQACTCRPAVVGLLYAQLRCHRALLMKCALEDMPRVSIALAMPDSVLRSQLVSQQGHVSLVQAS